MAAATFASLAADGPIAEELHGVADRLRAVTVAVEDHGRGGGSGIVWPAPRHAPAPLVVTNAHVVGGKRQRVHLPDGRTVEARLVRRDARRDLALLELRDTTPTTATVALPGDARALRPGDLVLAFGHPLGVRDALSVGVLHAHDALLPGRRAWVRADVRLAPGNSGGPLADAEGRVIGVNTMIAGGLALAVPTLAVERFLRAGWARPALGVTVRPVAVRDRERGRPRLGLLVTALAPGGAAAGAGLLVGDVLLGAAGLPFAEPDDLADAVAETSAGDVLPLAVRRAGADLARDVVVRAA